MIITVEPTLLCNLVSSKNGTEMSLFQTRQQNQSQKQLFTVCVNDCIVSLADTMVTRT